MLEHGERSKIKQLLSKHFGVEDLKYLVGAVDEDYDSIVRRNVNKIDAIMDILEHAERNGWTMKLLQAMISDFEERLHNPSQKIAVDKVRDVEHCLRERLGRGTALEDPFKSCFVRGDRPFINRPTIRNAFAKLYQQAGLRIATINGPPGSGKSYSKELPQFVSEIQEHRPFKVYYRDLSEGEYTITAEKLAWSILLAWKLDLPIPTQLSQSSSYAAELSEWLAAKVPQGETWWIILDGAAKIAPDPGLVDFLLALARHIVDSPHGDLRLVLLDMGEQHPLPPQTQNMTIPVKLREITKSDLVEHYFKMLYQNHPTQPDLDLDQISDIAQRILDLILEQAGDKQHLARLQELLLLVTKELGLG